ncbi:hypothetical protein MFU01_53800 [Myxococcus fulvus]|uniref:Uncharacterized protein n=1 Tax=Myxococcus fulvus TaxID=33 RepID=A0A511T9S9_MYXFU|nr:hypothetical protein MFU01_53800 [Myxococcus fulvus]
MRAQPHQAVASPAADGLELRFGEGGKVPGRKSRVSGREPQVFWMEIHGVESDWEQALEVPSRCL